MSSGTVRVVYPTVLSSSFRTQSLPVFCQRRRTKPEDSGYEIAELPLLVSGSALARSLGRRE